ncbi:MAG: ABC transporter permease [Clostridiales Family XIII bacterium]|nr:ABC transporter permease [Clostridiales Family XIII bacterium]
MTRYLIGKILQYVLVLIAVSLIIFVLARLSPTDPVSVILGGKQSSQQTIENLRHEFNLDRSAPEQYAIWASGMIRGDFGKSFKYRQQVSDLIAQRLPVTGWMVALAALIAIAVAIPAGIVMAVKQHRWQDTAISVTQLFLVACPPFLTAIIMIWMLYTYAPGIAFTGTAATFPEFLQRIALPAIALSFVMIALLSRIMKTGMAEELRSDYFIAAKAKGMRERDVIMKHCFRNAIIPVITALGTMIGILLVESVLVEEVFSLQGLGSILVEGVTASDYPLVQGITMFMVFIFMTISTILDIAYGIIDPRIRKGKALA